MSRHVGLLAGGSRCVAVWKRWYRYVGSAIKRVPEGPPHERRST
jgi:hypothetical protein